MRPRESQPDRRLDFKLQLRTAGGFIDVGGSMGTCLPRGVSGSPDRGSIQSAVNTSTSFLRPIARMLASNVTRRTPRRRANVSRCASVTCR